MDVRWFSPEAEACAADWRRTTVSEEKWEQAGPAGAAGGEAQGFFVQNGATNGYAKDSGGAYRAAHEKIASDLAFELRLPVPPIVLWAAGGHTRAISRVPFDGAFKWGQASQAANAVTRMMPDLSRAASAMVAFDTWVDNTDRINDGNLIVSEALPRGFGCAYIDYAFSMSQAWGGAVGGPFNGRVGPYPGSIDYDEAIAVEAVGAIETLPASLIEEIVRRIPDAFMEQQRRESIVGGLLDRQAKLRAALGL